MKAVILVGGEATRLRPLTCNLPKAMVPIVNTPFLEYVIYYLRSYGIVDIILTQRGSSRYLTDYFGDGSRFGVKLGYTVEESPMGTAGAVKNAERYLDETFLVLNGDIFTDLDLSALADFHKEKKAKAVIALTAVEDPTQYGLIETDSRGRVTRFLEKPKPEEITTDKINAGTYILDPSVLSYIPPKANFSFERELFPTLLKNGEPVYGYVSSSYWIDIGTPEKYLKLNCDLVEGRCRSDYHSAGKVKIGKNCAVHQSVDIDGLVTIGDDCIVEEGVRLIGPVVIGRGCHIKSGAIIQGSIIWHDVEVGPAAEIRDSIIANGCRIGARCIVPDSFLGDNVTVTDGCRLEPASRLQPLTEV